MTRCTFANARVERLRAERVERLRAERAAEDMWVAERVGSAEATLGNLRERSEAARAWAAAAAAARAVVDQVAAEREAAGLADPATVAEVLEAAWEVALRENDNINSFSITVDD